ncbi:hypothetical protein TL16_g12841 [Triparma laevis f. inornata]|uniref:Uncharacterized protein n=1 Tax=Triparma laevis f. inornata TaxID=1714386 RepID=A0A9W7EXL7_9STRA|nr:hypothetical protein TL16_g12841 [Triparma laevis f. inornata]
MLCHLPKVNPAIDFLQSGQCSIKFHNSSVQLLHVAECPHGLSFALATVSDALEADNTQILFLFLILLFTLHKDSRHVWHGAGVFFSSATHIFLCHFQCDFWCAAEQYFVSRQWEHAGGKHGLPQWKKNLMLKEKLKAMEDDLKITVRNAELQSDLNVSRYTEYINGKDHLESLSSTLRQSKDDTVSSYTNAVSVKNDNVTRLKLILNLKKSNFVNYYPEWMRFMQKIREVRDEHGYSNKTKWRTVVGKLLREGSRAFGERNGQGEKVLGDFRRLCVSFNAYGHKELEEELNKLEDKAGDVEAEHDPTFQVLRLEYRMARDNWREASSKKPYLDPTVQVFQSTKLEMQALAKKNRDLLGIKHEDSVLERLDHRKAAKMEEEEKTKEGEKRETARTKACMCPSH